jgi:hypothetical protein
MNLSFTNKGGEHCDKIICFITLSMDRIFLLVLLLLIFIIEIFLILIIIEDKIRKVIISKFELVKRCKKFLLKVDKLIKYLFLLSSSYLFIMIALNLNRNGKVHFLSIISLIIALGFIFIAITIFIIDALNDKSRQVNRLGIIYLVLYIILVGIGMVQVVANNVNSALITLAAVMAFVAISILAIGITIRHSGSNKYRLIVVSMTYVLIIVLASWIFGLYYVSNRVWNIEIIKTIDNISIGDNVKDSFKVLWYLSKYSIGNFYNYPSKDEICIISFFQYYMGKFMDVFLLGYVFNIIYSRINLKSKK